MNSISMRLCVWCDTYASCRPSSPLRIPSEPWRAPWPDALARCGASGARAVPSRCADGAPMAGRRRESTSAHMAAASNSPVMAMSNTHFHDRRCAQDAASVQGARH